MERDSEDKMKIATIFRQDCPPEKIERVMSVVVDGEVIIINTFLADTTYVSIRGVRKILVSIIKD